MAGLGGGIAAGGGVWTVLGQTAFYANAVLYLAALVVYRVGVSRPRPAAGPAGEAEPVGRFGYRGLVGDPRVWLLGPTWMAINAALGLYTSQTLFQLLRAPDPRVSDQLMVGGFSPLEVTLGFAVGICVFFAGLACWGRRFAHLRRTTIIAYGIAGGGSMALVALALNHSGGLDAAYRVPLALVGLVGLFVLAGATPAALGLLADMSEAFPHDRGAIMGLYGVFLGLGQVVGLVLGGLVAEVAALDGVLVATFVLMAVALVPLARLRRAEPRLNALP